MRRDTPQRPTHSENEGPWEIDDAVYLVTEALRGLCYGKVTITVHDDKITEIEVSKKKR